jgi:hypothetical protein
MFSPCRRSISVVPHSSIDISSKRDWCRTDLLAWLHVLIFHVVIIVRSLEVNRLWKEVLPDSLLVPVVGVLCSLIASAGECYHMAFRHRAAKCFTLSAYVNMHPWYGKALHVVQLVYPILRNFGIRATEFKKPENDTFTSLILLDFFLCCSTRHLWNIMQFGFLPMFGSLLYIALHASTTVWAHTAFLIIDVRLCIIVMSSSTWVQLRDPSELLTTRQRILHAHSQTVVNLQMNILMTSAERINAIQLQVKNISKDLPAPPQHAKTCLLDWTAEMPLNVQRICEAVHIDLQVITEYFLGIVAGMEDRGCVLNTHVQEEVITMTDTYSRHLRQMRGSWRCVNVVSAWLQNIQINGNICIDGTGMQVELQRHNSDILLEGGTLFMTDFLCRVGKTGRHVIFFSEKWEKLQNQPLNISWASDGDESDDDIITAADTDG